MAQDHDDLRSDRELLTAAEDGDEQAFAALYDRYAPLAWRFALALSGSPDDAARVVTETFARTFTIVRAGRVALDTTVRSLVLTTVRNVAIDLQRDATSDTSADTAADVSHETRFAYAEGDATTIAAAFAPLPERWRSVLWLTDAEGMRIAHVAPVVGLAARAASSLAARATAGLIEQYLRTDVASTGDRNCSRAVARLGSYVAGTLPAGDSEKLERHLELCDGCRRRRAYLYIIGSQLVLLALPVPATLADDARAAWAAAVATPARRGLGLSSTAEKVLAGVSAFAAAVGVLGATLFDASHSPAGDDTAAAPVTPAASNAFDQPVPADAPVVLPAPAPVGSGTSGTGASGTSSPTGLSRGDVVGTSNPAGGATPATGVDQPSRPTDPRTTGSTGGSTDPGSTDVGTPDSETPPATKAPAPLSVGTTVADTPVAVEVGDDPGVTVGPVSVGSEPAPGDSTVSVDGPLAPLDPVVSPISTALDTAGTTLGL